MEMKTELKSGDLIWSKNWRGGERLGYIVESEFVYPAFGGTWDCTVVVGGLKFYAEVNGPVWSEELGAWTF